METLIPAVVSAVALVAAAAKMFLDGSNKKLDQLQQDITYIRGNGQQTRTEIQMTRADFHSHAQDDSDRFEAIRLEIKTLREKLI